MNLKTYLIVVVLSFTPLKMTFANPNSNDLVILDVRTPEEYKQSHLEGALLINIKEGDFKEKVAKLDKSKTYKVYCRTGNRSGKATEIMRSMGFENVENVGGLQQAAKELNRNCEGLKSC